MGSPREKLSLSLTASIPDLPRLRFLMSPSPSRSTHEEESSEDEGRADHPSPLFNPPPTEEIPTECVEWLSTCLLSVWGSVEYVGVATGTALALLGRRGHSLQTLFGRPLQLEEGEEISSLLLMGVASKRVADSVEGVVCLVGTSEGSLSLFSETGSRLFSHRLASSPITSIRAVEEEVLLVAGGEVVVLPRPSLYALVVEARKIKTPHRKADVEYYVLRGREEGAVDAVPSPAPSSIDRLADHSLLKFHGKARLRGSHRRLWLSSGHCFGVLGSWEREWKEGVRDSMLKWGTQYLPSFLQSAMTSQELSPRDSKEAREWRVGRESRMALSLRPAPPPAPLAAIPDNLGRVLLLDTRSGQLTRLWKGYRDASCAWIDARPGEEEEGGRRALFLSILAPRRNLLEVWSAPNGRRVAARVVRGTSLVESSVQVLAEGVEREEKREEGRPLPPPSPVYLLGYKGNFYEIGVSFESILSMANDDEERDKMILREASISLATLPSLLPSLRTPSAQRSSLMAALHSAPDVDSAIDVLGQCSKIDALAPLSSSLVAVCRCFVRLVEMQGRAEGERVPVPPSLVPLLPLLRPSPSLGEEMPSLPLFLSSFNLHCCPVVLSVAECCHSILDFFFLPLLQSKVESDEFVCLLQSIKLSYVDMGRLFFRWWEKAEGVEEGSLPIISHFLSHLLSAGGTPPLDTVEALAAGSVSVYRGGVVLGLCRLLKDTKGEEEEEEFEAVGKGEENEWMIKAVNLLGSLSEVVETPLSMESFLASGPSLLLEAMASLVSRGRLSPPQLRSSPWLGSAWESLPRSLAPSFIHAHTAWLLIREWTGKSTFDSFLLSAEYAKTIECGRLRMRMTSLLWKKCLLGAVKAGAHETNADADLHSHLVPHYRRNEFFSTLSNLLESVEDVEEEEEKEEEEREEWLKSLFVGGVPVDWLVEVAGRETAANGHCLRLHRQLLAVLQLSSSVGWEGGVRELFPSTVHSALFGPLSTPVPLPSRVDGLLRSRRSSLIDKAAASPLESLDKSLTFLCHEWHELQLLHAAELRRALRRNSEEAGLLVHKVDVAARVGLLVPAIASRLKVLAEDQGISLSLRHRKVLNELAGDEFSASASVASTRELLAILMGSAPTSPATKQLREIAASYFGFSA